MWTFTIKQPLEEWIRRDPLSVVFVVMVAYIYGYILTEPCVYTSSSGYISA